MYTLRSRSIPLNTDYDVIVVGGGPSGCTAAAAAARTGAKTLLLEATGSLGGMGTSGLVPAWCPFSDKERIIYRGLAETVFERSKALSPHVAPTDVDWVPIDPEGLKRIYDDLMQEYGVTVLFNTFLCDVDAENGEVHAIVTANKAGFTAYSAKTYIDCTGDGDLAVWAGARYEFEEDGEPMPSTLCFILSNVDLYAYLYHPKYGHRNGGIHPNNKKSFTHLLPNDDRFPEILDTHLCNNIIGPNTVGFNAGHLFGLDSTDPKSVSEVMMRGRRIAKQYRDALATYFPEAFGNAYLVATAPVMGVRESRMIDGVYTLTVTDLKDCVHFEDGIAACNYDIDIHNPEGTGTSHYYFKEGTYYTIPYRSLMPKNIKNLLAAGRCISGSHEAQASFRIMPTCCSTGEATGVAAAVAAQEHTDFPETDVKKIQALLRKHHAFIGE